MTLRTTLVLLGLGVFLFPGTTLGQGANIKAGDMVKVKKGPAPVTVGKKAIALAKAETILTVEEAEQGRYMVTVQGRTGWIEARYVARLSSGEYIESLKTEVERLKKRMAELEAELRAVRVEAPPPETVATRREPVGKVKWRTVKTWRGTGLKKTEQFTIKSETWRVRWRLSKGDMNLQLMQVMMYEAGSDMPDFLVNTDKPGSDISYVHRSGTFRLEINAMGSWQIAVEEGPAAEKAGGGGTSSGRAPVPAKGTITDWSVAN